MFSGHPICNYCQLPIYSESTSKSALQGSLKLNCHHTFHSICHPKIVKILSGPQLKNEILCPLCEKITTLIRECPFPHLKTDPSLFAKIYLRPFFKEQSQMDRFLMNSEYSSIFDKEQNDLNKGSALAEKLIADNYTSLIDEIIVPDTAEIFRQIIMERKAHPPLLKAVEENNLSEALKIVNSIAPRIFSDCQIIAQGKGEFPSEWYNIFFDFQSIFELSKDPNSIAGIVFNRIQTRYQKVLNAERPPFRVKRSVFQKLHCDIIHRHYKDNSDHLWKGYRVFGGDGCDLKPEQDDTGSESQFEDSIRIFQYVELTTDTIVAPCIAPNMSSDRMALALLSDLVNKMRSCGQNLQLYVYDKGFYSPNFVLQHFALNVDFLFRVPFKSDPRIDKIVEQREEADFEVGIGEKYPAARVIIKNLSSGKPLILVTSLTDKTTFSANDIIEAYQLRYRNDESYKFQKFLLQLENYPDKALHAILQEYWGGVCVAAKMSLLFVEKEEELRKQGREKLIKKSSIFVKLRDSFLQALVREVVGYRIWSRSLMEFNRLC